MIAAFQMYDWPEAQRRHDAFWSRVANNLNDLGFDAPSRLSRPQDLSAPWPDARLLLGQTCGLPFVRGACGDALVVARPDFGVQGARSGFYRSAIIARANEDGDLSAYRRRRLVVNGYDSQSGCNALADTILRLFPEAPGSFFRSVAVSGAHRLSATMVAEREADIAAIDAVSWALYAEAEPTRFARLRVIGWTRRMPALPFITAARNRWRRDQLFAALRDAAIEPSPAGVPVALLPARKADYEPIRQSAQSLRGLRLAPTASPIGEVHEPSLS